MGAVQGTATQPRTSGRLFTIGIPVFNGKSLLRNCLQSVIASTLPRDRFEIVIADDGSTEPETHAILEEFTTSLAADPGFFRVISLGTNSGGAARPRNRILDEATGEYIFFIDSDDTIGDETLERVAAAVAGTPADWIALNQVPVNGRGALCLVRRPYMDVRRIKALATLTVHKVFRRAEIERQRLRFDEGLPSGQDVAFAFSFILNASRFLMLGGYDFYYLTQHADDPNEPAHLSRRANTPAARIEKNERILRSMLTALRKSNLPDFERRQIVSQVTLPRVLVRQGYLKAIVKAGPVTGTRALRRLARLLADPLVADLHPNELKDLTPDHLAKIARADWAGLAYLLGMSGLHPKSLSGPAARLLAQGRRLTDVASFRKRGRRFVDVASGRARHRRVINELALLRRSVEEAAQTDELALLRRSVENLRIEQRRLEANLQAEFHLRDMLAGNGPAEAESAITPLNPGWQLSSQGMHEVVRHVLLEQPELIVECGSGISTMWIGRALRRMGQGRLISLESSAEWVATVEELLRKEGLSRVEVRHAPLEPFSSSTGEQPWYAVSALTDIEKVDLLLVDGPPGNTAKHARYPAVPALRDKLRPGTTVMLDDYNRRDEKETLRRWLEEVPGLTLVRQVDRLAVMTVD